MECCCSETESLWYGSWNRHVCRKGKCASDHPYRSTRENPSRNQWCCSRLCFLSQVQRDTSDPDNSQNLGYWLIIRHRCICMWSWIEMLTFSFQLREKTEWSLLRRWGAPFVPIGMPTICWKTFPPKTTKMLSTRNSSMLMMSSSVYLFLEPECSLTKYGSSRPKTKNLYLWFSFLWMKEFRMKVVSLLLSFWLGMVV